MLVIDAARRWKETWEHAWPRGDIDAIAALYAPSANYRALAFRDPYRGVDGVRQYLRSNVEAESGVICRFGDPIASDTHAVVEWWASWEEDGEAVSLAGVTLLRFDAGGLVVDHRDYWNQEPGRTQPYDGW